jgi:cytidine deaminase
MKKNETTIKRIANYFQKEAKVITCIGCIQYLQTLSQETIHMI